LRREGRREPFGFRAAYRGLTAQIDIGGRNMLGTFLTQLAGELSSVLGSIGQLLSGLLG